MLMRTRRSRWANFRSWTLGLALIASACKSSNEPTWNPISAEDTKQLFVFSPAGFVGYFGHGFLLTREGHAPLGITSLQAAGQMPGTPTGPTETTAWLRTLVDSPTVMVRLGQRYTIAGARAVQSNDSQHDLAAFAVLDPTPERALELAASLPAVGDTVYVLAMHYGDSPLDGPRRHPAQVMISSDVELNYVYLASSNTYLTSGAAVLDKSGHVVGVNVASFVSGPRVHGLAVGVNSLRSLLPD
jgi:hypothetical protein